MLKQRRVKTIDVKAAAKAKVPTAESRSSIVGQASIVGS